MNSRTRRPKIQRTDLIVTCPEFGTLEIAAWELDLVAEAIETLLHPQHDPALRKEARDEAHT